MRSDVTIMNLATEIERLLTLPAEDARKHGLPVIEEFRAGLQPPRLSEYERLLHIEVDVEKPRHDQRAGLRVAVGVQGSELKRVRIEPAVNVAIGTGEVSI